MLTTPPTSQAGVTLISLLIGMVISLLCITTCLVLYKSLIRVATDTQLGSIYDGQLASALLTAQLEMQIAGFGIEANGANHVATSTSNGTVDLLWRHFNGTNYICRGLRDTALTTNSRSLEIIATTNAACTATAALTGLSWTTQNKLAEFKQKSAAVISVDISTQSCWPYGVGLMTTHKMVTITASSAAQTALKAAAATPTAAAAIASNSYAFCLPNT